MRSRIYLRVPVPGDCDEFLAAVRASRGLHHPWVKPPGDGKAFLDWLARMQPPANATFLVCRRDTGAIAGVVNVSNIVRGAFQNAYLGYYCFAGHERQGVMRDGLRAVMKLAFDELGLHRLEANIQPANLASIRLVKGVGFQREGFSPKYLKIGGRWRDHERWAIRAR